ncbi:MAG: NifB/NifX family molybdenum-iron cluster-binding protein [Bacilli bacterium]|jgi:predicted Fe-Mo cluster-binding NifX family protein|nr:NifB/NifX family molybdenum-iron cluster-binding protein [Bacilli bacterium]MDD3389600.1 NifB/NifX family molybdenum-iron cluster-binding protein [Bacilli bacterium]MDD4345179.1 NifB/NifX family molybdenum-iron cluster-binding protein [Bacilli bacterium]
MKLAIALTTNDIMGPIGQSFGRSGYFGIYDLDTDECYYIENTASAHHGGAGVSASQFIIDQDVSILIIPRCGENAYLVLESSGIALFKAIEGNGRANIEAYKNGKLSSLGVSSAGAFKGQK